VGPSTPLLKTADDAVVMVSCERTAGRILVLSSRLDASDLPLRIAFPVMMTNSVNWFLRQSNEIQPALATGQSSRIGWTQSELNVGADRLSLISPDGERTPLQFADQRVIVGPRRHTGVYGAFLNLAPQEPDTSGETARETEGAATNGTGLNVSNGAKAELVQELSAASPQSSLLLAVNLCQAAESDLRLPPLPEQQSQQIPASGLPLWLILCLVAGAFIVLEWVLFHRRIVA